MQESRLLSILLILSNKGLVTAKDLSEHFEVSIRTIYRDIDKLCVSGIPIASQGGKGGGYYLLDNYNIEQLFLDRNEAKTFLSVMDSLDFMFGKNKQFNQIVLKLQNTYKNELKEEHKLKINLSHFSLEQEIKDYLYFIDQQIESNHLIIFDYINRRLEYEERTVEPIQIIFIDGNWYLTAFCLNRQDYRRFKLTRMRNLKQGDLFTKRSLTNEEIDRIFKKSYEENSINVTFKFQKETKYHLTEFFKKEEILEMENGSFLVQTLFPNDEGLIHFILGFGTNCEILEPLLLRDKIKKHLKEMEKIYFD